jgi:hypothetical protein
MAASEPGGAQQPRHPLATHVQVQAQPQLGMHPSSAIGPAAAGMDPADLLGAGLVGHGLLGQRPARPGARCPRVPPQHAGKTGDGMVGVLLIDQPVAAHR